MGVPLSGLLRAVPNAWGPKVEAESGEVTQTRTGPNEISFTAPANLALVMLSPQPNREVSLDSDRKTVALAPIGAIEIVPAGAELFARWAVDKENVLVAIDERRLSRLAGMEFGNDSFELQPPKVGLIDRKALVLANLMREEFQRGPEMNELCFDGLITLFATHLLRSYSSLREAPDTMLGGGLSPRAWRSVSDYIQDNLSERLSVARLADVANLSPSHFLRAFRRTTGQTPHQYLVAQRLTFVERLVRTTDTPLDMVARSAGFSSNSHMTATLKRLRGLTPTDLRREVRRG